MLSIAYQIMLIQLKISALYFNTIDLEQNGKLKAYQKLKVVFKLSE